MKFVALLSGGKDSCYNIVHCNAYGHELVAAASLRPPPGQGEIDSFMYQTVGQDAIELVARALGVPLFRRTINGSAVEQGGDYGDREGKVDRKTEGVDGDETEDMYALLSEVKSAHPEIQGVSVGAILSNYQRVRVDHVCQRLSLTPLCYLWQRDQRDLMAEMIAAGVEAILIKVAGIGLQEKHLGKTLAQMEPMFHKLHDLYGAHICGEGGEYETLTLDCPAFKQRISIKETKTIVHSDHAFATVAYLEVKDAVLEDKPEGVVLGPTIPPMLDALALLVQQACSEPPHEVTSTSAAPIATALAVTKPSIRIVGSWAYISNVQQTLPSTGATVSIEDEVNNCFKIIKGLLSQHQMSPKHIVNTTLLLSSMDLFPRVNLAYGQYFGTSPPSRACVAVDLPPPTRIRIACVAFRDEESSPNQRQGLHVQGVSYWAPANIGPYSQAVIAQDQVYVSGQIGLVPARMALPSPPSFATEAALAFQHAVRVISALRDGPTTVLQGVVVWTSGAELIEHGRAAWNAYSRQLYMQDIPAVIVAAKSLPKDAMIEVQVLAHSNRPPATDETDSADVTVPLNEVVTKNSKSGHLESKIRAAVDGSSFSTVLARNGVTVAELNSTNALNHSRILSIKVFHNNRSSAQDLLSALETFACTYIPVRGIASPDGQSWDIALCIHSIP
ncbi:hypothetical protein BDV93DRAFT_467629 [Ceratobasidium sp. AG-I]|nr:hypothetical protein BDV93DRAFT_467629 [Ceratobasidium sp. AG-I]